jgi:ribosome biogenesis protein MAK21
MSQTKGKKSQGGKKPATGAVKTTEPPQAPTQAPKSFEQLKENIEANLKKKNNKKSKPQEGSSHTARGKKRNAQGDVVPQKKPSANEEAASADDEFQAEVRALGGDRDDLILLADVDSDSEVEGTSDIEAQPSKRSRGKGDLEKGMQNILKEIALVQGSTPDEDELEDGADNTSDNAASEEEEKGNEKVQKKTQSKDPAAKSPLRFEPRPDWFSLGDTFDEDDIKAEPSSRTVEELSSYAKSLLQEENEFFKQRQQSSSSQSFYNTVIQSGTLTDKISALTLAVQESPIHNVKALESLLGLAGKRSRSQAVDVLRALKDLFAQGSLLPADRRLHTFASQPGLRVKFGKKSWSKGDRLPKGITEAHLVSWSFEDLIKEKYFEVIKILEVWCNDEIEFAKLKAVSYVYELLKEKPEQESNLLRLLINKLGDPVKRVASQASYLLMQLLTVHPAMKGIVVAAVDDFIFRPGQALHAKYYATVTINQTALSSREEDLAVKLLGIYFGLFTQVIKMSDQEHDTEKSLGSMSREQRRRLLKKKKNIDVGQPQAEELREKLTSALLTGVNRAYPYAGTESQSFAEHFDTLFKIVHSANFNTCIQAMLLIQQLSKSHQASSDRFYRVLYESLLDQRLITASKQQLYLNLLHRSLKADLSTKRVKAFVKRILQVLSLHEPPFICGAFFLLKDLDSTFPGLTALVDHAEEFEDEDEVFRDVDEDRGHPTEVTSEDKTDSLHYDGHKRAPEHANADNACAWELLPFLAHFHPAVTISADSYLQHQKLPGAPDLSLHTLIHFLDRFIYKNAKISETRPRGASIMQPMVSENARNVLLAPSTGGIQRMPVTSDEFRAKQDKDVAAEDVFFHKYFANLGKEPKPKFKKQKADYDTELVSDDEDAVWDAMMKSAPELEGVEDSDEDLSMSDLESAMDSDDKVSEAGAAQADSDDEGVDVEAGIFDDSDEAMDDGDGDLDPFGEADSDAQVSDEEITEEVAHSAGDKKKRGKKMKSLPTFASVDDYAAMLDNDEGEDLG